MTLWGRPEDDITSALRRDSSHPSYPESQAFNIKHAKTSIHQALTHTTTHTIPQCLSLVAAVNPPPSPSGNLPLLLPKSPAAASSVPAENPPRSPSCTSRSPSIPSGNTGSSLAATPLPHLQLAPPPPPAPPCPQRRTTPARTDTTAMAAAAASSGALPMRPRAAAGCSTSLVDTTSRWIPASSLRASG